MNYIFKWGLLLLVFWMCASVLAVHSTALAQETFNFQDAIARAALLAKKPFQVQQKQVPEFLLKMSYDDWRDIRFLPAQSLWLKEKLPFTAQFFHPGFYYSLTVTINVVDASGVRPVRFSPDMFDYGRNDFKDRVPPNLGFAGFRLHYPINTPKYYDEVVVFLGASYLRALAKNQNYGISARGLAIDTGLAKGEEFPYFREFWLVKPQVGVREMTLYALLDSPSLTGAYRYVVRPGRETILEVRSAVFMRQKVEKLGIAPLTSMFYYGENTNERPDDYRPEVHDSDGLQVATGTGEWIWRPLRNPHSLLITSFAAVNPIGFGLIQRDTNFDHYQDLEANYQSRPSVWISPIGKWGKGRVELIQIPEQNEINDNIVAFWVPARLLNKGQPIRYAYKMIWHFPDGSRAPGGRAVATRTAKGKEEGIRKFIIDFAGERLEALPADKPLTAVITVDPRARLLEQQLYKNRMTNGWRLVFQIRMEEPGTMQRVLPPQKRIPLELRAFLKLGDSALTETWSYAYQP